MATKAESLDKVFAAIAAEGAIGESVIGANSSAEVRDMLVDVFYPAPKRKPNTTPMGKNTRQFRRPPPIRS